MLYTSLFVSIYLTFNFAAYGIAMLPSWFFYPRIVLMILGILIRQWAIAILGPFFSVEIGIQEGQKVVDKGPYRLVRHPSYTGVLLILVGIGLTLQSWGAILTVLMIFRLTYSYRIYVEERALVSGLGDEYIKYSKRTKRLIPFIL